MGDHDKPKPEELAALKVYLQYAFPKLVITDPILFFIQSAVEFEAESMIKRQK